MQNLIELNDLVYDVRNWFAEAMCAAGRPLKQPKSNDYTKTYQYRSIKKFTDKSIKWGLDKPTIKMLINSIVKYAKTHDLLNNGASVLHMSNVLNICMDDLDKSDGMEQIIKCHNYLIKNNLNSTGDLLKRRIIGGYPYINVLYDMGILTNEYLALSINCKKAIERLSSNERLLLPSDFILMKLRIKLLNNSLVNKFLEILENDLNTDL